MAHNRFAANRARTGAGAVAAGAAGAHASNAGRQGLAGSEAFRRGNGFENASFGGRRWNNGGYRQFWAGGVFWPFFFGDYFSYVFWPYDYYDSFWGWGPDALLWGAFWPYYDYPYGDYGLYDVGYPSGPYAGDIYAPYRGGVAAQGQGGRERGSRGRTPRRVASISPEEAATTCTAFAPGVTDPVQRVAEIIQPTPEQQSALTDLKGAMAKAASILSQACPAETPATPVARLDAMEQRLVAMQEAQDVLRGPLERLYGLLSDQQKNKLDAAIGTQRSQQGGMDLAKLCSSQAGFTNVPADDLARTIKLDARQTENLGNLKQASAEAAKVLRDSCPLTVPQGLDARLDAAQKRTGALIEAIHIVRPQVQTFFASLSGAEKTALNSRAPVSRTASNR